MQRKMRDSPKQFVLPKSMHMDTKETHGSYMAFTNTQATGRDLESEMFSVFRIGSSAFQLKLRASPQPPVGEKELVHQLNIANVTKWLVKGEPELQGVFGITKKIGKRAQYFMRIRFSFFSVKDPRQ